MWATVWVAAVVGCVGGEGAGAGEGGKGQGAAPQEVRPVVQGQGAAPEGGGPAGAGVRLVMKGEEIPESGRFLSPDGAEIEIRADGQVNVKRGGKEESASFFEPGQYRASVAFMLRLQEAIKGGKIEEVAGMVSYPLRINGGERPTEVKDKDELIKRYAEVFTASVRGKIVSASAWQLFARNGQVMLGDGVIWAEGGANGAPVGIASMNP